MKKWANLFLTIFSFFLYPYFTKQSKILIWSPTYSRSHVISNGRIADLLTRAGHDVVLAILEYDYSSRGFNGTQLATVIRIDDISDSFATMMVHFGGAMLEQRTFGLGDRLSFEDVASEMCAAILRRSNELNLLRSYNFDLAFNEQLDLCGIGVARYLGIKQHIWISSTPLMDSISYNFGVPSPPSYVPSIEENDVSDVMSWTQRGQNLYMHLSAIIAHIYSTNRMTAVFREICGQDFPSVRQIASESALVFVNSDEFLDFARPILHKTVYIGGIGIGEPKPLDEKFSALMNRGTKGVIIMSLGTVVPTSPISEHQKREIFKAFSHFSEYHFVWKIDKGDEISWRLASQYPNVDVVDWIPQSDILGHPRLSVFIMHSGMNGLLEAAIRGVPIITIPIFADQYRNSRAAEKRGFGYPLSKERLNYEGLKTALDTVLSNQRYKTNAVRLSQLIRHKPFPPERRLVEWTEFVLRHGNLPELQVEGVNLNLFVYFCLDIIIPLLLFVFFSCYMCVKCGLKLRRCLIIAEKRKCE